MTVTEIEERERLLESVEQGEREIREAVDELASAAHQTLDLGERMADRPWSWFAVAAGIGFWLGLRSR